MSDWAHKDIWTKRGKHFTVEVSRHTVEARDYRGPNRWAVYAYVYPKHPHFKKFHGESLFQPATEPMPLHGGASLLRYHFDAANVITSVQVGADYDHLHDAPFTYMATAEDAASVFSDADELVKWLEVE